MYINAFPPGSIVKQVLEVEKFDDLVFNRSRSKLVNVPRKAAGLSDRLLQKKVDLGWSSEAVNVNIHGFLEALNVKDRSPEKFIDETKCKGISRRRLCSSKHDPSSQQHDGEGTISNQQRHQRDCVSSLAP